jgi:hypothetical protein
MALTYDSTNKKWNLAQERTDYPTNYQTDLHAPSTLKVWTKYKTVQAGSIKGQTQYRTVLDGVVVSPTSPGGGWGEAGDLPVNYTADDLQKFARNRNLLSDPTNNSQPVAELRTAVTNAATTSKNNAQTNNLNAQRNQANTTLNTENTNKNNAYNNVLAIVNSTQVGDYVRQRELIRKIQGIDDNVKSRLEGYFKDFYSTEKLKRWTPQDEKLAEPLYGTFDAEYYKSISPDAEQKWKEAVANDDIDITEQYSEPLYYQQHYTLQGRPAGRRGNAAEQTTFANQYIEKKATDAQIQLARDFQLGIDDYETQAKRILKIPQVSAEWDKAKTGDEYWTALAKEKSLDLQKPDEFVALFRLSQRPEDKQVSFTNNLNAGYGITELEDVINQAVGEKAIVFEKKFGALTQNVLKDTIEQMKKAKAKEQEIAFMQGFSSFGEIMNINKELSNSILGDSGVGGILSFTSGNKSQESLEKNLQKISGINNSVTYNWQQWFDKTLKEKYKENIELGYSTAEAKGISKIESQFARDFIDQYLTPRFNTARSISEFVEYLDVRKEEQNPFQTESMLTAVNNLAAARSKLFLDEVQDIQDRKFDPDFYFAPQGVQVKSDKYAEQTQTVAKDWEKAKAGDKYWAEQAYRFGIDDLNDKKAFARMHFEVKGQGLGYDAAEDILTKDKVSEQIYNKILPALNKEVLDQKTTFGQFITPEEFSSKMLEGLDPNDKTTWQKALKAAGVQDFQGTLDEFKDLVSETLRTGSAQEIRQQIKYLNEKGKKPTQEILGVEYIERPEDYTTDDIKTETEMYRVFRQAGYKGTEDEFYTDLFPDTDRSEQQLLTKAGADSALQLKGLDLSDPFASLGTIQSFFGDEDTDTTDETTTKEKSIFNLGLDDEETSYKSKTGSQILGEFTSMFKGF